MTLEQFEAQASEKRLLAKVLIGLIVFFVIVGALFGEKSRPAQPLRFRTRTQRNQRLAQSDLRRVILTLFVA